MNALKNWLVEAGYELAVDATSGDIMAAAKTAKADGKLTAEKQMELLELKSEDDSEIEALGSALAKNLEPSFKSLGETIVSGINSAFEKHSGEPEESRSVDAAMEKAAATYGQDMRIGFDSPDMAKDTSPSAGEVLKGADKTGKIRIKKAIESYESTKMAAVWTRNAGQDGFGSDRVIRKDQPAYYNENGVDRYVDMPSERDKAIIGVWTKLELAKSYSGVPFTEHDENVFKWALRNMTFCVYPRDPEKYMERRKLTDLEIHAYEQRAETLRTTKATVIIDDSTSGGEDAVPEVYDDEIIRTPLLHSELFPHVRVIALGKGAGLEGASIGTPTFVSTASGSAITPMTTDSFVSDFTIPVFPASVGIKFGHDFLSDALPTFFAAVRAQIVQESMRWLDEQIAIGDGTTEPQGLQTASGQSVSSTNGTSGALVVGDSLNLIYGIDKAHRHWRGGANTGFVMGDSTYKQFRAIATGVTGDSRLLYGMNVKDYDLHQYPVWVQNNITAGTIMFANLAAYRLVRRQPLQFITDDSGSTLRLANARLLLGRMRWGGKIELTTHLAQMTDGSVS